MNRIILFGAFALSLAFSARAELIFSTDFAGGSTTSNEFYNFSWTVGDAAKYDLAGGTLDGFAFSKDSVYNFDGGMNASQMRNGGGAPQFNLVSVGRDDEVAPLNTAIFSFAFEVKAGNSLEIDRVEFNLGTASTGGGTYTSGIDQLGEYNVRIFDGTTTTSFYAANQNLNDLSPTDSMPFVSASPESTLVLGAGTYRMDILHQDKDGNGNDSQRTTIDNLAVYAIPEPSTLLLAGLAMAGALIGIRRR